MLGGRARGDSERNGVIGRLTVVALLGSLAVIAAPIRASGGSPHSVTKSYFTGAMVQGVGVRSSAAGMSIGGAHFSADSDGNFLVPTAVTIAPHNEQVVSYTVCQDFNANTRCGEVGEAVVDGCGHEADLTTSPYPFRNDRDVTVFVGILHTECGNPAVGGGTITVFYGTSGVGACETMALRPTETTNVVGEPVKFVATLRDSFENLVSDGTEVDFFASGTASESPATATALTGGGKATFTFTATRTGISYVGAYSPSCSATATGTWVPGAPASISIDPSSATQTVGATHTVVATVTDQFGNAVADGTAVDFSVSGTGAESPPGGSASTTGGRASFSFTSTLEGTSTVWAYSGGISASAQVTWTDS